MFVVVNFALKRFLHFLDVLVGNQSVTRLRCKTDTDRTFLFLILQLCYFNVDQKEIPFKLSSMVSILLSRDYTLLRSFHCQVHLAGSYVVSLLLQH